MIFENRRLLILIIAMAVITLVIMPPSFALGIGKIEVSSFLNENLESKIYLDGASDGVPNTAAVGLASRNVFELLKVPYSSNLYKLNFSIENKIGRRSYIRVWSEEPLSEPYLTFVLEYVSKGNSMSKKFTVLLDPKTYAPRVYNALRATQKTSLLNAIGPIGQNDTLWPLAERYKPSDDISVEQMMLAFAKKNPKAFGGGNINVLLRGSILAPPSMEEIMLTNKQEARAEVSRQYVDWKKSRNNISDSKEILEDSQKKARLELLEPLPLGFNENDVSTALLEEEVAVQAVENAELEVRLKQSEEVISFLQEESATQLKRIQTLQLEIEKLNNPSENLQPDISEKEKSAFSTYPWVFLVAFLVLLGVLLFVRTRNNRGLLFDEGMINRQVTETESSQPLKEMNSLNSNLVSQSETQNSSLPDPAISKKDPIAGLNVYLAYERYQDAKKMLEQAIIDNPNEPSYRIKILEVLAAMDNLEEFREQAVKAEEIIGLNTVEWANIKSLWEGLKKSSEEKNLEQSKEFVDDEREADSEIAENSKQQISDTGESGESVQSGENLTSTDAAAFEIDLDINEQDDSSLSIYPVDDKKD